MTTYQEAALEDLIQHFKYVNLFKVDLFVSKIELLAEYSIETFFEHFSKNEVISGIT